MGRSSKADFAYTDRSTDLATRICAKLAAAKASHDGKRLVSLPPGTHHVHSSTLHEKYCFVSNNDDGLKRVLFDLEDEENLVIDGCGAELLCHGRFVPFVLQNCRNVTIRNFTIDWPRTFLSQATVLASGDGFAEYEFGPEYPVDIEQGRLVFYGDEYRSEGNLHDGLEFDPTRRETAYKVFDNYGLRQKYSATLLAQGRVRIEASSRSRPTPGNVTVFMHDPRLSPAITIDGCENVRLENITLYHAGGMGVVGQCSRDIELDNVNVLLRPDSGRVFSILADATHFVDCEGRIHMTNCTFENQLDDPTNIHGIFRPIVAQLGPNRIEIALKHAQQLGVDTIRAGDTVGFYDAYTFELVHQAGAAEVSRINCELTELSLHEKVPDLRIERVAVMKMTHDVDVLIRDCEFRGNRARGVLLSTLGKVRVERNRFHVPGSAIKVSGDIGSWYESGPVEEITITENVFDNCNYGVWGTALIDVDPEIERKHRGTPFHRNIRICGNTIHRFHRPLVFARSVDGLEFTGNDIHESSAYPPSDTEKQDYIIEEAVENANLQPLDA